MIEGSSVTPETLLVFSGINESKHQNNSCMYMYVTALIAAKIITKLTMPNFFIILDKVFERKRIEKQVLGQ